MPTAAESMYPGGPKDYDVGEENLNAADAGMQLSSEEKKLYNLHLQNLMGTGGVDQSSGKRSSLLAMTAGEKGSDKTYLIPRVHEGKILSEDEAFIMAKKKGLHNYPSYSSQQEATDRYTMLHHYMEKDTERYQQLRGR